MPPYSHFVTGTVDFNKTADKMHAMKTVGVPYTDAEIAGSAKDALAQGTQMAADLASEGVHVAPNSDMVAIVAYVQSIGKKPVNEPASGAPLAAKP